MYYGISGTRIRFHPEWRYDFNSKRNRTPSLGGPTLFNSNLGIAGSNRVRAEAFDWPILGPLIKNHYMMERMDKYLNEHGMTWADVDPLKMNEKFGSNSSTVMYVSKNIMRLYR